MPTSQPRPSAPELDRPVIHDHSPAFCFTSLSHRTRDDRFVDFLLDHDCQDDERQFPPYDQRISWRRAIRPSEIANTKPIHLRDRPSRFALGDDMAFLFAHIACLGRCSGACGFGLGSCLLLHLRPPGGNIEAGALRRSEITVTGHLRAKVSADVMNTVDLAAHTRLRVRDLVRLSWSHVGEDAIVISTGKSRHKRDAYIPLYDDLRELLKRIPKRSTAILTNSRKKPWTADGLNSSFAAAMPDAKLKERDLHFHDLQGTAATKFYIAGLSERVIAEIMGWEEPQVAKIIRRYVSRTAATKAIIRQIDQAKPRTYAVKLAVKPTKPTIEKSA